MQRPQFMDESRLLSHAKVIIYRTTASSKGLTSPDEDHCVELQRPYNVGGLRLPPFLSRRRGLSPSGFSSLPPNAPNHPLDQRPLPHRPPSPPVRSSAASPRSIQSSWWLPYPNPPSCGTLSTHLSQCSLRFQDHVARG